MSDVHWLAVASVANSVGLIFLSFAMFRRNR